MSCRGDGISSGYTPETDVPDLDVADVHARLFVDFRTGRRFSGVSVGPSRFIPSDASTHDPVLFSGAGDLADKSRWHCFLLPSPRPGSVQYPVALSLNLTFGQSRSHKILSAPRPSCTCPQIASEGRTRHNVSRKIPQPDAS